MKKYIYIVGGLVVIAGVLLTIRFFSGPEDTWLCKKGLWVQHGFPERPRPSTKCGAFTVSDIQAGLRSSESSTKMMEPHFVEIGSFRGRKVEAGIVCYGQLCTPVQYNMIRYAGVKDKSSCKQVAGKSWFLDNNTFSPALLQDTQIDSQTRLSYRYVGCEPLAN